MDISVPPPLTTPLVHTFIRYKQTREIHGFLLKNLLSIECL